MENEHFEDDQKATTTTATTTVKQTKKISLHKHNIRQREKALRHAVAESLASGLNEDVSDKILKIEQIHKVIEWQRGAYFTKALISAAIALFILVALSIIPSRSLSLVTPGFIDANTSSMNLVLANEVNWSGKINLNSKKQISFENFSQLTSQNYPQVNVLLDTDYAYITSDTGASLESLFIPKGTRVWFSIDPTKQFLKIDLANRLKNESDAASVKAKFRLFGDVSLDIDKDTKQQFAPRACPASIETCRLPRIVEITGQGSEALSLTLPLSKSFELIGLNVEYLSFSKFQLSYSPAKNLRCSITDGRFQLRNNSNSTSLNKGECLALTSDTNRLSLQGGLNKPLNVRFYGELTSLLVGAPEFNDEHTPNLLNWLVAYPSAREIGALFAAIIAIIGIIINTVGIKK